ncbi:MAG: hypothetical protein QNJ31_00505 [Candidatus Caenarcaniphilales bacterium]|nr:hypothetical protein [Candidatus Caenarcaniphilales bacterium]
MLIPYQIHTALKINVIGFKVFSDTSSIKHLPPPSKNTKYIAVRFVASNPGKHRGRPTVTFDKIIDKIYIDYPSYEHKSYKMNRPELWMKGMFEDLSEYKSGNKGILLKELKPGESMTGWLLGSIPKDINPPYVLKIQPSKKVGRVVPLQIELKSI